MVTEHGHPVRPREQRLFRRLIYTSYWTTFELTATDMKAASVGILDQTVAGPRQWSPPEEPGRFSLSSPCTPR
jgi:hypothetical protein